MIESLPHNEKSATANLLVNQIPSTPENIAVAGDMTKACYKGPEYWMIPVVRETGHYVVPGRRLLAVKCKECSEPVEAPFNVFAD